MPNLAESEMRNKIAVFPELKKEGYKVNIWVEK